MDVMGPDMDGSAPWPGHASDRYRLKRCAALRPIRTTYKVDTQPMSGGERGTRVRGRGRQTAQGPAQAGEGVHARREEETAPLDAVVDEPEVRRRLDGM